MNVVITIIKMMCLCVSIILLVSSCIRLYRWRKSAFDSTTAYLRNLRYISPGEKECIQAPDEPEIQYVRSEKSSKTMVYWEYCYTVGGIQYCKSYFHKDDESKLPSKIKIHYNRKNPKIMYRESAVRDGVIISVFSIILGAIFLFAVVASYIW
jgi:hypothetical protein